MKFLSLLIVVLFLAPTVAFALECSGLPEYSQKLCNVLNNIAGALYIIAGGLALVIILIGGITYMTSAGTEEQVNKAKKIILNGLIGAAVVVCAGFILDLLAEFLAPLVM